MVKRAVVANPMPQYDVYANPSRSAADGIPYVVVIQSDLLDALPTRLTLPLALLDGRLGKAPAALCPLVTVNGQRLQALGHFAAPTCRQPGSTFQHVGRGHRCGAVRLLSSLGSC